MDEETSSKAGHSLEYFESNSIQFLVCVFLVHSFSIDILLF